MSVIYYSTGLSVLLRQILVECSYPTTNET